MSAGALQQNTLLQDTVTKLIDEKSPENERWLKIKKLLVENNAKNFLNAANQRNRLVLHMAIRRGSAEICRGLIRFGADVNASEPATGNRPLTVALTSTEHDIVGIVRVLLANGADISYLNHNWYKCSADLEKAEDWLTAITRFKDAWTRGGPMGAWGSLFEQMMQEKSQPFPVGDSVDYWLRYRSAVPAIDERLLKRRPPELIELEILGTIGQRIAKRAFGDAIIAWWSDTKRTQPLVLAFCGLSGHGKTQMAIEFVRARALPESQQITINCQTEGDSLNEILGSGVGYVGSERSSRLNSFFRENDGKEAVVLLDEFEKCPGRRTVWDIFLGLFDKGEYRDRQTSKSYRLNNFVFILTSNVADVAIGEYLQEHSDVSSDANTFNMTPAFLEQHKKALEAWVRRALRAHFGPPLTGRISSIVPFVTFSKTEAAVVSDGLLNEWRFRLREPPGRSLLFGNIELRCVGRVNEYLASAYFNDGGEVEGARTIRNKLLRDMRQKTSKEWSDGKFDDGTSEKRTDLYCTVVSTKQHQQQHAHSSSASDANNDDAELLLTTQQPTTAAHNLWRAERPAVDESSFIRNTVTTARRKQNDERELEQVAAAVARRRNKVANGGGGGGDDDDDDDADGDGSKHRSIVDLCKVDTLAEINDI